MEGGLGGGGIIYLILVVVHSSEVGWDATGWMGNVHLPFVA